MMETATIDSKIELQKGWYQNRHGPTIEDKI